MGPPERMNDNSDLAEAKEPLLSPRGGTDVEEGVTGSWDSNHVETHTSGLESSRHTHDAPTSYTPSARPGRGPAGSTITFWDIGFEVPDRRDRRVKRRLLQDVCGVISPGQVLAIMGPSGCGKTSLLEILGGRNSPTQGGLLSDNRYYDDSTKMSVGFVPQEDALFGTLSVYESVLFHAELRLPLHKYTLGEKRACVHRVLEELNLMNVKDSLIGDKVRRGISGGERKRVSMARELVYDPLLLLLDEPTSGLDSYTSIKVMRLLRSLASHKGRTIAASIHQPSSLLYALFDQLMLLASGRVVYCGPAEAAVKYMSDMGLECPRYANPADFFLSACCDESTDTTNDSQLTPKEVTARLIEAFAVSSLKADTDAAIRDARRHAQHTSALPPSVSRGGLWRWVHEFCILVRRSSLNSTRNPLSSYVIIGRTLIMALLVGSLYWQIDLGASGVMDRSGALFFVLTNQVMSSLASLTLLLDEREIVSHEARSALYPVSAYFSAKQVAELPLQVTMAVLLSVITYWMVGFQAALPRFLCYSATMVLASLVAESYILLCGSFTTSGKVAMVVAPVLLTLFMLFSGFFINSGSIPVYYRWIKYVSFFNYLNVALQKNEFHGLTFAPTTPNQPPLTGDEVIESLHLLSLSVWQCLAVVAGMTLAFRLAAFAFVRVNYRPPRFELPKAPPSAYTSPTHTRGQAQGLATEEGATLRGQEGGLSIHIPTPTATQGGVGGEREGESTV